LHRNQSRSEEAGVERHLTVFTAKKRRGVEGSGNRNWAQKPVKAISKDEMQNYDYVI